LLAELLRPRKAGLFETTVQFTEEGTTFIPTCISIQDMLETMTEAIVHTANGVGRLLYMRPFNDILLLQQQQQQHAATSNGATSNGATATASSSSAVATAATAAATGVRDGPNIGLIVRAARDFTQAATNISEKVITQQHNTDACSYATIACLEVCQTYWGHAVTYNALCNHCTACMHIYCDFVHHIYA
jgi:hypothetical protein